jgi:hypothetical protein
MNSAVGNNRKSRLNSHGAPMAPFTFRATCAFLSKKMARPRQLTAEVFAAEGIQNFWNWGAFRILFAQFVSQFGESEPRIGNNGYKNALFQQPHCPPSISPYFSFLISGIDRLIPSLSKMFYSLHIFGL